MSHNIKVPLLRAMGNIFEKAADSKLNKSLFSELEADLQVTTDYFRVSPIQAFFIAHIFVLNYNNERVSWGMFAKHFDCNVLKVLEYTDEMEAMILAGIIQKDESMRHRSASQSNDEFLIHSKIEAAMLSNSPLPQPEPIKLDCFVEFLERIADLDEALSDSVISTSAFYSSFDRLIVNNTHFDIINQIHKLKLESIEAFIFLKLVWEVLNGSSALEVEYAIRDLLKKHTSVKVRHFQEFLKETHKLQSIGWVSLKQSRFLNDAEIELTEESTNILTGMGLQMEYKKEKNKNVLAPASIATKELYFNDRETEELETLQSMLLQKNFKSLQGRLKKKSLPCGLTVLFYGHPGTGKTESVLQMAKRSGREIYKVDISQTKSMWFGESEKTIRKIFTNYSTYAKRCKLMPILLFNEADAILSKRKDSNASSVAQTENAIQNIILEELENFDGIFMATTNLKSNMDPAFDRRFLFKVEFDRPETKAKARIWQSKLPFLSDEQLNHLADTFDFTGGQIDNVARKCETHYVLHGKPGDLETVLKFCESENLHKVSRKEIGFKSIN